MREDLARAIAVLAERRQYASYFEWIEKDGKELGVGEQFMSSLNASGLALRDLALQRPDPPDLVCVNSQGGRVGIELAELVCEDAVRLNAKGTKVFRAWRAGDLTKSVSELLVRKDSKSFHGGPYSELLVCLFTDEPALTVEAARAELARAKFGPFQQIARSFLMFSYQPSKQGYPVIEIEHHA